MTGTKFDGQTTWEPTDGLRFTWNGGWEAPGQDFVIDKEDLYWTTNLDKAQRAYGDPNIHYNTDDNGAERYLVFGDGTRVPADGTLAYRDSASNQNWINNGDGTFTKADQNFKPVGQAFAPAGYRRMGDGRYAPIDSRGNQVGPLNDQPANYPGSPGWHESPNGVFTPLNTNGDYYQIDPATGQHKYFDKNGNPISKEKYLAGTPVPQQTPDGRPAPPAPGNKPPLQSTQVNVPDGMSTPEYPAWATDVDPDIPNQMTGVVVRLYELFGSGSPATSELPEFPFSTDTGERSGIDAYDDVKPDFKRIESEFDAAAKAFKTAVENSANVTKAGRDAINNAIGTFNSTAKALEEGDWDGLLQAESTLLDTVKTAVEKAANTQQDVPANPAGGPPTPMGPAGDPPPAIPSAGDPSLSAPPADDKGLEDLLNSGSPFGGGMPMGGNPLGGLGGMNPLGGLGGGGNPMGGGGNPLSPLSEAVKPLSKLAETDADKPEDKKSPITPLNAGPANAAPPPSAPGATPAEPAAVAGTAPPVAGNQAATATPAGNSSGSKPTVTLPDGKVVEAPNKQAADAAQNAIDKASPGGDAAQKAYSPTGLDLPGDGKNLGAKVDPSDMQPGDVLKWQDKTMVAVAPGLVADPSEAGKIHTLEEVFKDQKGFEGVFRPTETDPTLSTHTSAPPLTDPQVPPQQPQPGHTPPGAAPPPSNEAPHPAPQPPSTSVPAEPPPDSVPLSGPGPAGAAAPQQAPPQQPASQPSSTVPQAAPPSPFENDAPPPATRTTKHERIAAGLE